MSRIAAPIFAFLLAAAAGAQTIPAGSVLLDAKESFKIGGGCGSLRSEGVIYVSLSSDGNWTAQGLAGMFSGTASPADTAGRRWNLQFDAPSLELFVSYFADIASGLCEADVTITDGGIERFELKLDKKRTKASLRLKTSATGFTVFGSGTGKHQIKGKGAFTLAP